MGLDSNAIFKLISELKDNAKNKMGQKKNALETQLLEYKRSSISHDPDIKSKRSQIISNQKSFQDARDQYWLIKEIEWYLTRIEVAKYAAQHAYT